MKEKFKGIFTALLTPFDDNNKINEKALEALVKHNVAMGADGFYVCGSTAEAFLLTTDERKQVMEIVNQYGGDPDRAFQAMAQQNGINPQEIMNMLR